MGNWATDVPPPNDPPCPTVVVTISPLTHDDAVLHSFVIATGTENGCTVALMLSPPAGWRSMMVRAPVAYEDEVGPVGAAALC